MLSNNTTFCRRSLVQCDDCRWQIYLFYLHLHWKNSKLGRRQSWTRKVEQLDTVRRSEKTKNTVRDEMKLQWHRHSLVPIQQHLWLNTSQSIAHQRECCLCLLFSSKYFIIIWVVLLTCRWCPSGWLIRLYLQPSDEYANLESIESNHCTSLSGEIR